MSTLTVERAVLGDPLTQPLIRELTHEYVTRYGDGGQQEMARYGAEEFTPPDGLLLLLLRDGEPVAGGAYRRHESDRTAEVKRMWTAAGHRRQGLGRRVLAELEDAARQAGYRRIHLTTGPLQPEAKGLYLAAGYTPLFDVGAPPQDRPLPFEKDLHHPDPTGPGPTRPQDLAAAAAGKAPTR
ncbi:MULTISPECIES: GNAT family N-acetyltransferase [Kitasatospora]|uniref:Putative acetyltransferase n=1 Tax=Kitasatospora setae (strain ATCC 33774 / DSM 43861 / JCM 3304 / KCC A-0304 / NBRC 14216 / KM-6054) TaxID=452652 RepID=E4NGX7_KITSK|nr:MULTISPECIES: GNAT family N-acetyltransferase [Kitasatospora]BAJ30757.1 putative acetyltransferase [Kitasatospora setae KM-6054]